MISRSAFDLDAVLHTLVKSASDLCHATMGCIYLRDGDVFRPAMQVGWTQEFYEFMRRYPMTPGRGSVTSRAALTGSVVHIPAALADPEYTFSGPQVGGFRTLLGVPLIRDSSVMGVFVLARPTVKPFKQREIELVQTFSDQALIALENVRLFDEVTSRNRQLTESLEQQTATNDILSVISSSPTNLQPVFDMIAEGRHICAMQSSVRYSGSTASSSISSPSTDFQQRAVRPSSAPIRCRRSQQHHLPGGDEREGRADTRRPSGS